MNVYMKEAKKQYFKQFRVLLIITGILAVIAVIVAVMSSLKKDEGSPNKEAPAQRVYDYANSLSSEEVYYLEECIKNASERGKTDIILLITDQEMGIDDAEWQISMMNCADDFYDDGKFGYNEPYGDGALLLYNWYTDEYGSQKGVWLSTSGKMEKIIGWDEEDDILDALENYIFTDPVRGYAAAIERIGYWGDNSWSRIHIPWFIVIILPVVVAFIYAVVNMKQKKAEVSTTATTYVHDRRPTVNIKRDDFIRKNVTYVKINTSSSSGGSSSHRGGGSYGSHSSSSGHSHGGGGRRH